jgi:hypothetical protein
MSCTKITSKLSRHKFKKQNYSFFREKTEVNLHVIILVIMKSKALLNFFSKNRVHEGKTKTCPDWELVPVGNAKV